jgi:uncharacterized membrane protein YvbJ
MYCKNCGKPVDDNSSYCSNCGAQLSGTSAVNNSEDNSSFGFALAGFLVPLVGLILFLVYDKKNPKRAKSAGKGALIGLITQIFLYTILVFGISVCLLYFPISL